MFNENKSCIEIDDLNFVVTEKVKFNENKSCIEILIMTEQAYYHAV